MLSVTLLHNAKINVYCEKSNYITSSYLGAFRGSCRQPFLFENSPENTGGRVLFLLKLQTDCSEQLLYIKMAPPRKEIFLEIFLLDCSQAAAHSHPFSKISPENTGDRGCLFVKLQTGCSD